jgi:hypothetical protein
VWVPFSLRGVEKLFASSVRPVGGELQGEHFDGIGNNGLLHTVITNYFQTRVNVRLCVRQGVETRALPGGVGTV